MREDQQRISGFRLLGPLVSRTVGIGVWLVLGSLVARAEPPDESGLFAEQIDAQTPQALIPQGPDAVAGLGDWILGNGTVCATVSSISHESFLSGSGGVLVDLAHCGRGDDQWVNPGVQGCILARTLNRAEPDQGRCQGQEGWQRGRTGGSVGYS